jgi:3-deoxy-D-manno-octulosonic-acid transferase
MKSLSYIFYNFIVVPLLYVSLRMIGLFNDKTRRGIKGRKRVFEDLIINSAFLDKRKKLIWFHSSSLGEFEQAKPIIEELKKNKKINILVTFFSPSGFENSRKYPFADIVSYIPFDSVANASKFINIVHPDLIVIMRYDIWPNHIWQMKKHGMKSILVDATMKKDSPRKLPLINNFHKNLFKDLSRILTVSREDADGFSEFNVSDANIAVVGDTRFDRVYQKSLNARELKLIREDILQGKKILVAGSTWDADEDVILPAFITLAKYDPEVMLIIAPHEPTLINLEKIEHEFTGKIKTIRFSHLNHYTNERVIIVDSIGILLTLYTYADAAFIGGSFKQNIHNTLEAAVYGIPLFFGPKIDNSQEAKHLVSLGGAEKIRNKKEAYRIMRSLFSNSDLRKSMGKTAYEYVHENLGATKKIISEIYSFLK